MIVFVLGTMSAVKEERIDWKKELLFPLGVGEPLLKEPEARMWAYCLTQGIATALGSYRTTDLSRWGSQDRFWFLKDERWNVGSCNWICQLLGLDRKRLIRHVFKNRHTLRKNPYKLRIQYND